MMSNRPYRESAAMEKKSKDSLEISKTFIFQHLLLLFACNQKY